MRVRTPLESLMRARVLLCEKQGRSSQADARLRYEITHQLTGVDTPESLDIVGVIQKLILLLEVVLEVKYDFILDLRLLQADKGLLRLI